MGRHLYGQSLPVHAVFFGVFAALFVGFVILAVVGASHATYTVFQWLLMGFLTVSAGLSAAWELRVMWLIRRGDR